MRITINGVRKGVCCCEVFDLRGSFHCDLTSSDIEIIAISYCGVTFPVVPESNAIAAVILL